MVLIHSLNQWLEEKKAHFHVFFIPPSLRFSFLMSYEFITPWLILPLVAFCPHVLSQVFISMMQSDMQKTFHTPYFFLVLLAHCYQSVQERASYSVVLLCCWERAFCFSPFLLQWNLDCCSSRKHTMLWLFEGSSCRNDCWWSLGWTGAQGWTLPEVCAGTWSLMSLQDITGPLKQSLSLSTCRAGRQLGPGSMEAVEAGAVGFDVCTHTDTFIHLSQPGHAWLHPWKLLLAWPRVGAWENSLQPVDGGFLQQFPHSHSTVNIYLYPPALDSHCPGTEWTWSVCVLRCAGPQMW